MVPRDLKYTDTHEWIRSEGPDLTVGVTDFVLEQLGRIIFLDLPAVGSEVTRGQSLGVIESDRAASDINAPVAGIVTAVNTELPDNLSLFETDLFGRAWLVCIRPADTETFSELLTPEQYESFLKSA